MDPLTLALIGGNVVGGLLSSNEQRKQRAHEMRMKAAEIENQPYMKKDVQTQAPSIWASMLGGGLSGLSQAQALQRAEAAQTLAEAQAAALQKGSLPVPMAMDPELDYEQMNQSYPTNNSYSYFQGQGPSMWNRMSYNPTLMGR
jgi:hypothetical protein